MKKIFITTDSELKERNGQHVDVLRELSDKECDREDVGKMYRIMFADGFITDAFEDEINYED